MDILWCKLRLDSGCSKPSFSAFKIMCPNTSITRMNNIRERGSPCRSPRWCAILSPELSLVTWDSSLSVIFDEKEDFENVFARNKGTHKPESSKTRRPPPKHDKKNPLPYQAMPKMQFPKFDGQNTKIWKDNCLSYFELYQLPEGMWITAAHLHFEGNAAKWYQAYKQNHTFENWGHFCSVVEEEFGSDDFKTAMNALLDLKQTGTVEDYTSQFQAL